jgi:Lon protease-like protein
VGQDRFRILSLDYQSYPYLVGRVEALPLATTAGTGLAGRTLALRRQVERFLGLLVKMGSSQFDLSQLPQSPSELAYVAAALLQISPSEKQRLLELEEMSDLVDQVHTIYRRELALLRVMSLHLDRDDETAFSRN